MARSATMTDWNDNANGTARAVFMPRWFKPALIVSVVMLLVTGFGQMPIYARYYVSSIPGLAWTGDFYLTHLLHYLFALVFLALLGYAVTRYAMLFRSRYSVTPAGWIRVLFYAGIVVTGVMRVLKNDPNFFFNATTVMFMDIGHLAFVMFLGAAALAIRLSGRRPYLKRK